MKKTVLLIGLGRFGRHVAEGLVTLGHQVMAVDKDEERVNDILPIVTASQIGDSANESFLRSLGINNFDLCIVAIAGDFQSSLETTSLLKELGAKFVVSRAERDVQAKFLSRNGADAVVYPERQVAKWTVIRYSWDNVMDFIDLDDNHAIFEVTVPSDWVGRSIGNLDVRKKYGVNVIAVKQGEKTDVVLNPDMVLAEDMTLFVLGENKALQKCFKV